MRLVFQTPHPSADQINLSDEEIFYTFPSSTRERNATLAGTKNRVV